MLYLYNNYFHNYLKGILVQVKIETFIMDTIFECQLCHLNCREYCTENTKLTLCVL